VSAATSLCGVSGGAKSSQRGVHGLELLATHPLPGGMGNFGVPWAVVDSRNPAFDKKRDIGPSQLRSRRLAGGFEKASQQGMTQPRRGRRSTVDYLEVIAQRGVEHRIEQSPRNARSAATRRGPERIDD